ncbi:hypothetical protein Afil01_21650 [Actinorhabdospora filicis]|uniref:Tetratricopeptide repeat protein n=1 Tax=Actinorhabdospora filicis TaxID=1785913 RepID=A0A9W6SJE7_9ACTN|nr:tetratricopeptide repeat protein [Actinorhabdospora filicis]GLZ77358.1 hypothetical protein Afil01_21650 [Actinorhabdospora filicis]
MIHGDSPKDLLAAGDEAMTEAAFRTGDYTQALALLQAARDTADDRAVEAAAIDRLGWLTHFRALDAGPEQADADAEEALFQQALDIRRDIGDRGGIAASLFGLGLVHQVLRRDWDTAITYFRQSLALAEEHADLITRSEVHRHIGFYYMISERRPDLGVPHLRTSLRLRELHGDPRWTVGGLIALGQAESVAGDRDEAVRLLGEAIGLARRTGLHARRIAQAEEALRRAEAGEMPG